ncbi:MAG: hypothetical protein HXY36_00500 [Chloroflexi bacterium]|nr:hypothetical protein [Chloroflexota bacterium]
MACLLGVSYYRLQYLLERNYLREKQRRLIIARKEAMSMPGRIVTSRKLRFSCWLPDGWRVDSEDDSVTDLSGETQSQYEEWLSSLEQRDLRKEYLSAKRATGCHCSLWPVCAKCEFGDRVWEAKKARQVIREDEPRLSGGILVLQVRVKGRARL